MIPTGSPSAALLAWALRTLVESSALVLVALLLERTLLRGRLAGARHLLWWVVVARLLLPPELLLSVLSRAPVEAGALAQALSAPGQAAAQLVRGVASDAAGLPAAILLAWLLVAAALLLRLGLRTRRTRSLLISVSHAAPESVAREARRVARRLGLRRAPEVRCHAGPAPALVGGLGRPLILLSERLAATQRRGALWHECMHLRRRDLAAQSVFQVVRALWWFHPLLGLACARARAAREVACDLAVVGRLGPRPAARYHDLLLDQTRAALRPRATAPAALAWIGGPAELLVRLGALERPPARAHRLAGRALALGLAGLLLLAACGGAPQVTAATWWDDAALARAEARRWQERRPGLGCKPGQLVFLRALALERARAGGSTRPE
jgi:beta-lactamase regulating signal transducer with metallopeptidase domain